MCGAGLEIGNESIVTCEYCGTNQTLPKLDDEKRANMYDRAGHFRRNNDFDKAMGIYEQILAEDGTDAEAYWSLVLCKYGIEYVEDPATRKRVPTVNRAQYTSIYDDDNYKSALMYADGAQRALYEAEASEINEIQKGILDISQKEEPFDIFICYKETDNGGRRTPDSVLATELFHELTKEGFKVFFSRITLEDKLGTAYEPYIFAALNSAKVMVVLGTKPEYFNAAWVKNEWSRYLALTKSGGKKVLIPAYRDMDPYDLPDEFSHLQAQDMAKLGFMQDLTRGIKKIIGAAEPVATVKETVVVNSAPADVAPLLKRAFIFLEDGDWERADDFCEQVLNRDPEIAMAYLGKLMAELHVHSQDSLKDCEAPFDGFDNYKKVMRYGDATLKETVSGYIKYINDRNENARLEGIYNKARSAMNVAKTESDYKSAANIFVDIAEYKDSDELYHKCLTSAEEVRKDAVLKTATVVKGSTEISAYTRAIEKLETIRGWKNADELIYEYKNKIEELKAEAERQRIEDEKRVKRNRIIGAVGLAAIAAVIGIIVFINSFVIPNNKYKDAISLMENGEYSKAICEFTELEGYKDSAVKIIECNNAILAEKYNDAIALMENGEYLKAIDAFTELDGHYKDSADKIIECKYNDAIVLIEAGNLDKAYNIFIELGAYKDSVDKAANIRLIKTKEQLKGLKVGSYIKFGVYEHDNNTSNGKGEIEWLVLEVKDGKALVISKYALDCKQYNTSCTDVTWETCTLRKWLNNDFINTAFSDVEKDLIPLVTVSADKNPECSTTPGNATQDQIFLLSITEVNKYFNSDSARQCKPTYYAVANGAYVKSHNGNCLWWLRSPGFDQNCAANVYRDGDVVESGRSVDDVDIAVRPALWITIE